MADLLRWYELRAWDESDLIVTELTWNNWGLACRGTEEALVVLDYGYSADVDKLYRTGSSDDLEF